MYKNLEDLKDKYNEGYRCIYKENAEGCTLHLKNFEKEKIYTINSNDTMEIGEIDNFLDQLDQVKKDVGHDCFCTQHEDDDHSFKKE